MGLDNPLRPCYYMEVNNATTTINMIDENIDEYLTRCVVDTSTRTFLIYSNLGDEKVIECANSQEFLNVLSFVRSVLGSDTLVYAEPLVKR
jgi:hypothetical protein